MMHSATRLVVAAAALVWIGAATGMSAGQDPAQPPAASTAAPMQVSGTVEVGYRFTDVDGSADTFRQLFDLSSGARVVGVEMHGVSREAGRGFADSFTIRADSLGGDPFPSLQVIVRKAHTYDLRVNWRKSRFFDVSPLTPASIDGFDTQTVTDRHSWSTTRQIGNVAWTADVTERLHVLFNYDRFERGGTLGSTRSLDFVGAPAAWGAFARANPYLVNGRINGSSDRATGGFSYGRARWTVHYKAGYQVNEDTLTLDPTASPERSINVVDPATTAELLSTVGWSQSRRLKAPLSELTYVVRPSERFEWRGDYLYYRYGGPFSLDATLQGVARTNSAGTLTSPYQLGISTRGEASAPNQVVDQGMTYRRSSRWALDADYRYSRFTSDATGDLAGLLALYSGVPENPLHPSEADHLEWHQALHTLAIAATLQPTASLTIRPGVRVSQRDVVARTDGVVDPATSQRQQDVWPELNVGYRPYTWLSARGTYKTSYGDESYTRMSPSERRLGHVTVTIEPVAGLSIDTSADRTDLDFSAAGYVSHTHAGSVHASYDLNDRLSLIGGLDYQNFIGLGNATFLRGTAPINNVPMRDEETDRIWQAGATIKPASWLEITATGNFDRTTGTDAIEGEPPLYGPASFRYGTVSLSGEIPRVGRLSLDLQRASFAQDLLSVNNFRTNILMLRFSRGF